MDVISIYIFLIGLCIGSFLNVCIDRIIEDKSIIVPPSHCDICGYKLKIRDLVPVISYIFLKGKCRECKSKISIQYPIIELINAVLYINVYYVYGLSFYLIKYCILISLLLVIAAIDIKTKNIYTKVSGFGIVSAITLDIYEYIFLNENILTYMCGALLSFIIFYSIVKITGAMGQGDIDVAVICGLFLGVRYTLLAILLSFILGGIIGGLLVVFKKKRKNEEIAFIPYLALGSYITIFIGDIFINWYLKCY